MFDKWHMSSYHARYTIISMQYGKSIYIFDSIFTLNVNMKIEFYTYLLD